MKIIEKKSVVPLPQASGSISDTLQVQDKVNNAPSINLVQQMTGIPVNGIIDFEGTEDEIPEGYEIADYPFEKGSWNPTLICDGEAAPTYTATSSNGEYFKIGNIVFINFVIRGQITKLNGTNNYARIGNLPFGSGTLFGYALSLGDIYGLVETESAGYAIDIYNGIIRIKHANGTSHKFKVTSTSYFDVRATGWYVCEE